MHSVKSFAILFSFCFFTINISSQNSIDSSTLTEASSIVLMIGDDEELQSRLNVECSDILLRVDKLDMTAAYAVWLAMLSDLESFAEENDFNINGIKLWINVYWNGDGSIRNIIYYPKPNSRHIDFSLLSSFLQKFALDYMLDVKHSSCFSHFGSASFPTYYEQLLQKNK